MNSCFENFRPNEEETGLSMLNQMENNQMSSRNDLKYINESYTDLRRGYKKHSPIKIDRLEK